MTYVLITNEKHGPSYYVCKDEADVHKAAFCIVRDRLKEGYWYTGKAKDVATNITKTKDIKAAYLFMVSRQDYEYEGFDLEPCIEISDV